MGLDPLGQSRPCRTCSTPTLTAQEWRRRKGIDTILEQPQPAFDFAKGMYTHGVACFTKGGQPVWVDKIADLKRNFAEFKVCLRTAPIIRTLNTHSKLQATIAVAAPRHDASSQDNAGAAGMTMWSWRTVLPERNS